MFRISSTGPQRKPSGTEWNISKIFFKNICDTVALVLPREHIKLQEVAIVLVTAMMLM